MKKLLFALFLVSVLAFSVSTAFAASNVTLEWDLNTELDMAGYRVYQSSNPGIVPAPALKVGTDIPHPTNTYVVTDVPDGTWYWVITAYDTEGNESGPSNEVTTTLDTEAPAPPQNFFIRLILKIVMWLKGIFGGLRTVV